MPAARPAHERRARDNFNVGVVTEFLGFRNDGRHYRSARPRTLLRRPRLAALIEQPASPLSRASARAGFERRGAPELGAQRRLRRSPAGGNARALRCVERSVDVAGLEQRQRQRVEHGRVLLSHAAARRRSAAAAASCSSYDSHPAAPAGAGSSAEARSRSARAQLDESPAHASASSPAGRSGYAQAKTQAAQNHVS